LRLPGVITGRLALIGLGTRDDADGPDMELPDLVEVDSDSDQEGEVQQVACKLTK
jgi:hypothetical protein